MKWSAGLAFAQLSLAFLASAQPSLASPEAPGAISALTVLPATLHINRFDPDHGDTAIVVAQLTGAVPVPTDLALTFTASPGLDVRLGKPASATGDVAWSVDVRPGADAPDNGSVSFRLAYTTPATGASQPTATKPEPQVQRTQLQVAVEPARAASPADDADISIKADANAVSEVVSARGYVSVRNKSNYPFTIDPPKFTAPMFLTVTGPQAAIVAAPHQTILLPWEIAVTEGAKPRIGEWLVLAGVTLTRGQGSGASKSTAIVDQKVTVGVPGVSDVLKVLDLPSLLFVPGALVLATWSLLLGGPDANKPEWLKWKGTSFWLLAITISILIFWGLQLFSTGPDFLVAFGIRDVALLWVGCCILGAVTFLLFYRGAKWAFARWRDPQPGDRPIRILRKLRRADQRLYVPSHLRTIGGQSQQVFRLGFPAPEGKAWVVRRMLLKQGNQGQRATEAMLTAVRANDRPGEGFAALVETLDQGLRSGWLTLEWEGNAGPELLAADQLGSAYALASPVWPG